MNSNNNYSPTGNVGTALRKDPKEKEDNEYRVMATKLSFVIAIIMFSFFCADHIMCGYFYSRFHMPDISRALKILWFILLFFQQVILCKAFLRIRSGIIKLWTMIVFVALAICAIPLGAVYYTSEKNAYSEEYIYRLADGEVSRRSEKGVFYNGDMAAGTYNCICGLYADL